MARTRVLIVDDAVVIRKILSDVLNDDPDLEVVGTAANGLIALQKIEQLNPDLVTLDVEMPELDGLATLRRIRAERPSLPVIMFSTLTERGAAATIDALAAGASDYVTKPANVGSTSAAIERVVSDLVPRIKALTGRQSVVPVAAPSRSAVRAGGRVGPQRVDAVVVGSSTGGPSALETVLSAIGPGFPVPVLVVQHMPPMFTRLLAERLDTKSALRVVEAEDGQAVEAGCAYVAPGGLHLRVAAGSDLRPRVALTEEPPENSCRPAADVLFRSAVAHYGPHLLAVVLTGMGQDGLRGVEEIVAAGGCAVAQDEATSAVWGMPGYVARAGLAEEILPIGDVAACIERRVRRQAVPVSDRGDR